MDIEDLIAHGAQRFKNNKLVLDADSIRASIDDFIEFETETISPGDLENSIDEDIYVPELDDPVMIKLNVPKEVVSTTISEAEITIKPTTFFNKKPSKNIYHTTARTTKSTAPSPTITVIVKASPMADDIEIPLTSTEIPLNPSNDEIIIEIDDSPVVDNDKKEARGTADAKSLINDESIDEEEEDGIMQSSLGLFMIIILVVIGVVVGELESNA